MVRFLCGTTPNTGGTRTSAQTDPPTIPDVRADCIASYKSNCAEPTVVTSRVRFSCRRQPSQLAARAACVLAQSGRSP